MTYLIGFWISPDYTPPFLNISLFRYFNKDYTWMYIDILSNVDSLILLRM